MLDMIGDYFETGVANKEPEPKPYWLFGGEAYYSTGGLWDFLGVYESLGDAEAATQKPHSVFGRDIKVEWYHIVDSRTWEVVKAGGEQPYGYFRNNPQGDLNHRIKELGLRNDS